MARTGVTSEVTVDRYLVAQRMYLRGDYRAVYRKVGGRGVKAWSLNSHIELVPKELSVLPALLLEAAGSVGKSTNGRLCQSHTCQDHSSLQSEDFALPPYLTAQLLH